MGYWHYRRERTVVPFHVLTTCLRRPFIPVTTGYIIASDTTHRNSPVSPASDRIFGVIVYIISVFCKFVYACERIIYDCNHFHDEL